MSWFSIVVVLVCVWGAAWVIFLLLARRHRKPDHREITGALPPSIPTEGAIERTPTGGEVGREVGAQPIEEMKPSPFSETGSDAGKTQPGVGPELTGGCPSDVISVVEPSGLSGGESSAQAQEKESEVPVNQPAAGEAEREVKETTTITKQAVPQSPASQVGHEENKLATRIPTTAITPPTKEGTGPANDAKTEGGENGLGIPGSLDDETEVSGAAIDSTADAKEKIHMPLELIEDMPSSVELIPSEHPEVEAATGESGTKLEADTVGGEISGIKELDERQHSPVTESGQAVVHQKKHPRKEPRKYSGLARKPPEPQYGEQLASRGEGKDVEKRDRALPIEVRLLFERSGFCTVSLIARRSAELPQDLTVAAQSGAFDMRAMQDEWYQDLVPGDIAHILQEGIVWTWRDANGQCSWSLSGRELYVLAARTDLRGYISQPCLELGREHALLCTERMRRSVEEAIRASGATPTEVLDSSRGVPPGWIVFKNIIPANPVPPALEADILNALRPLPKIDIALEGGIRLEYTTWLEEHPPLIRVYGATEHSAEVLIDGHNATYGQDSAYRVSGWDSIGLHSVWCGGTRKSYTIIPFSASWEAWNAYTFPIAFRSDQCMSICGPLVHAKSGESQVMAPSLLVPESNPVVLGAGPGKCIVATRASALPGLPRVASPCFRPIWALPRDPLHCDKRTVRIIFMGEVLPPRPDDLVQKCNWRTVNNDVLAWCRMILDASRKGLRTEPDNENVSKLWLSYKRLAFQIWRARK